MTDTDPQYYQDLLARRFAGRKVILTGMVAGATGTVKLMRELGAEQPFLLAEGVGTGDLPLEHELEWILVGMPSVHGLMEGIRAYEAALANLSDEAAHTVERYDPDNTALVLRQLTIGLRTIANRRVYGAKDPRWIAYEDKTIVDAMWDRLAVPRAPSRIVPAKEWELCEAARELDQGNGTVWAADAREGWHGGSEGLRWIRDDDRAAAQAAWFAEHSHHVRVMPFLEGIPCSIHGMVFPDTVIAFRPVEQLTLSRPDDAKFKYSGCATFWDPPDSDREEMRELARRAGNALRDEIGFRGTFTIDGVMTVDGFRPTELNPRFGAGLGAISRALPELPLYWIDQAVCQGEEWDFRPHDLEAMVLESGDSIRASFARGWDAMVYTNTKKYTLVEQPDGEYRFAQENETPTATMTIGPSPMGSFLIFALEPEHNAAGQSVAPNAVRAFAFSDRELGTQYGVLEAARSVR
ncbi:MAG: hypothetical protein V3R91_11290 [Myxococcota bacterium]